ncbi:MAG: PEP-CTERM sorting domain-containing protein [Akkermansiaceae bacterium]
MQSYSLIVIGLLGSVSASQASLVITAAYDGPLSGGTPKGVELYVTSNIPDLSSYGLGSANNGGGSDGEEFTFPSVSAVAGSFIYVATEATQFTNFFGFAPDHATGAMSINGDDAIELFQSGVVIDTFGDINTDGTGQAWEYLDGWAYRKDDTSAGEFVLADWTFSGTNVLDSETSNATAASPVPVGTYSVTAIPEPSTALLSGLALFGLVRRKR